MVNDSRYTNQRKLWQEDMSHEPTNRPYAVMFAVLPVDSLSIGEAGTILIKGDPVVLNAEGLWVDAESSEAAQAVVMSEYVARGFPVSVKKKK